MILMGSTVGFVKIMAFRSQMMSRHWNLWTLARCLCWRCLRILSLHMEWVMNTGISSFNIFDSLLTYRFLFLFLLSWERSIFLSALFWRKILYCIRGGQGNSFITFLKFLGKYSVYLKPHIRREPIQGQKILLPVSRIHDACRLFWHHSAAVANLQEHSAIICEQHAKRSCKTSFLVRNASFVRMCPIKCLLVWMVEFPF